MSLHMVAAELGNQVAFMPGLHGARYYQAVKQRLNLFDRIESQVGDLPPALEVMRSRCAGWLAQLDKTITIDQRPSWASEASRYLAEWPAQRVHEAAGFVVRKAPEDFWSTQLRRVTASLRKAELTQRVMEEIYQAANAGWFIVFDTLTIAPGSKARFLEDALALRDHVRRLARATHRAGGRAAVFLSPDQVFRYFAVPEYGNKDGRLHFHLVYLMRFLPHGCIDPNVGRRVPVKRQVDRLRLWTFGFSAPIAVRFSGDAFTRAGWRWPVDPRTGKGIAIKPLKAVALYVTKYIVNMEKKGGYSWPTHFRVRMTRNFGMTRDLSMLSLTGLLALRRLHWSVTPNAMLLRKCATRELSSRLAGIGLLRYLEVVPPTTPLLELLRDLTRPEPKFSPQSFTDIVTLTLSATDISDEVARYLNLSGRSRPCDFLSGR